MYDIGRRNLESKSDRRKTIELGRPVLIVADVRFELDAEIRKHLQAAIAAGLAWRGIASLRFQFPYMEPAAQRCPTRAVLSEYDRWAKKHPNVASMMGGFLFFRYSQDERSDLLDFRAVGDEKWKIVHGWLRDRFEG